MTPHRRLTPLLAGLAAAGFAAAAVPSFAQSVAEITVMGGLGPDGRPVQLSRAVGIADLDLRSDAGVSEMRARVRATARDLCRELGETGARSPLVGSCEDSAMRSASDQMRLAVADARSGAAYALAEPAPYIAPAGPTAAEEDEAVAEAAASAADSGTAASAVVSDEPTVITTTVTNGPVPDTAANRARLGGPMSNAGQRTAPAGN